MSNPITKLRAIADFVEKHDLAKHLSGVGGLIWTPRVQLFEGDDNAIETNAIVEAGMYRHTDLPVALAVMRRFIRSGKDGAR